MDLDQLIDGERPTPRWSVLGVRFGFSTSFHRYPARLRRRAWRGIDVVPQDIKNREFGSGRTRLEMLRSMGRSPKIGLATKLVDGIQAAR